MEVLWISTAIEQRHTATEPATGSGEKGEVIQFFLCLANYSHSSDPVKARDEGNTIRRSMGPAHWGSGQGKYSKKRIASMILNLTISWGPTSPHELWQFGPACQANTCSVPSRIQLWPPWSPHCSGRRFLSLSQPCGILSNPRSWGQKSTELPYAGILLNLASSWKIIAKSTLMWRKGAGIAVWFYWVISSISTQTTTTFFSPKSTLWNTSSF